MRELHAFSGERVQVGRFVPRMSVAAEIAIAKVVDKDEEDIRFCRARIIRRCDGE